MFLRVRRWRGLCSPPRGLRPARDDRSARARGGLDRRRGRQGPRTATGSEPWIRGAPQAVPCLERVAAAIMGPGLCIAYRAQSGEILQRLCSAPRRRYGAPQFFADLYQRLSMRAASRRAP